VFVRSTKFHQWDNLTLDCESARRGMVAPSGGIVTSYSKGLIPYNVLGKRKTDRENKVRRRFYASAFKGGLEGRGIQEVSLVAKHTDAKCLRILVLCIYMD